MVRSLADRTFQLRSEGPHARGAAEPGRRGGQGRDLGREADLARADGEGRVRQGVRQGAGKDARRRSDRARGPRRARALSHPKLKGSIGEGSNHSNFSDESSIKILSE